MPAGAGMLSTQTSATSKIKGAADMNDNERGWVEKCFADPKTYYCGTWLQVDKWNRGQ